MVVVMVVMVVGESGAVVVARRRRLVLLLLLRVAQLVKPNPGLGLRVLAPAFLRLFPLHRRLLCLACRCRLRPKIENERACMSSPCVLRWSGTCSWLVSSPALFSKVT